MLTNLVWVHYTTKNDEAFGKFYNDGLSYNLSQSDLISGS